MLISNVVYAVLGIAGICLSFAIIFPALAELFITERKKHLDELYEENIQAVPFIKEHLATIIGEDGHPCTVTKYVPYYKKAVSFMNGKFIYLDQNIIEELPVDTDFTNYEQVQTLLGFWSLTRILNSNPKTLDASFA